MMHAYAEDLATDAMERLGEAIDFAVNVCGINEDVFIDMFIASNVAKSFEEGEARVILGLSGPELALRTLFASGLYIEVPRAHYEIAAKTTEYWRGYYMAEFQWYSAATFAFLVDIVRMPNFMRYLDKLMSANASQRYDIYDGLLKNPGASLRLSKMRKHCGLSQKSLADASGINIRTLQQYENGSKDINKAAAVKIMALSKALGCTDKDILEYSRMLDE